MRAPGIPDGNGALALLAAGAALLSAWHGASRRPALAGALLLMAANAVVTVVDDRAIAFVRVIPGAIVLASAVTALAVLRPTLTVTAALLLGLLGASLAIERIPGQRMSGGGMTQTRGLVPDRTTGQILAPNSVWHSYYGDDPRGSFRERDPITRRWRLESPRGGNIAWLRYPPDAPGTLRVQIHTATDRSAASIALSSGLLPLRAGVAYRLSFNARADAARSIAVGLTEAAWPWRPLGFDRVVTLSTSWRAFTDTVHLESVADSSRLVFGLGGAAPSVELGDIAIHELESGALVDAPFPNRYSLSYRVNNLGCRGADQAAHKPAGRWRLLILGDSYAFGVGVPDDQFLGARLTAAWRPAAPSQADSLEVLTCAVPGYGTREERQFYAARGAQLAADVVLLVVTANDARLDADDAEGGYQPPAVPYLPSKFIARNSAHPAPADAGVSPDPVGREIRALAALVRSRGARLAIASFRQDADPRWPGIQAVVRQTAAELQIPLLDLGPALEAETAPGGFAVDPPMDRHPNESAHALAATAIEAFLREQGLLPERAHAGPGAEPAP